MLRSKFSKLIGLTLIVALLVAVAPATLVTAQGRMVQVYLWDGSGPAWKYYTADTSTYIGLYYYWFAKTEEQVQDFLDHVTVSVTLNGQPLFNTREDAHIFWAPVEPFVQQGQPLYRAEWSAMLVPLDPGEYTIKFMLSLDAMVSDGVASGPFGPGVVQNTTNIVTVAETDAFVPPNDTTADVATGNAADNTTKPVNAPPANPDKIYDEPVVGTFVAYAQAYWAPEEGKTVRPDLYFNPGTTLWVFGMDSTRQYYKVLIDVVYLWVKADTIGPTYDATWEGRHLPNIVVQ
jgi:hypothetical protein